jgi:hypothetical protein
VGVALEISPAKLPKADKTKAGFNLLKTGISATAGAPDEMSRHAGRLAISVLFRRPQKKAYAG